MLDYMCGVFAITTYCLAISILESDPFHLGAAEEYHNHFSNSLLLVDTI